MGGDQYDYRRENGTSDHPKAQSGSRRRHRRISAEQGRLLMRILPLNESTEAKILSARRSSDCAAEPIAARIIDDVRKRGDEALFALTKKFDGVQIDARNLWVSRAELRDASKGVPRAFLCAIDHVARNIGAVAHTVLHWVSMDVVEP